MAIASPTYCTGREVWRLGMPRTVSPADPGLSQGAIGPASKVVAVGVGTLAVLTGAPWDAAQVRVEVVTSGALGTATARGSLDGGATWRPTTTIAADGMWSLDESGLVLLFQGAQTAGDAWTFATAESDQQAQLRRAKGAEIARWLRTRGVQPQLDFGDDLRELAAILVAEALLDGVRGFEPGTDQRRGLHARAERARKAIQEIADEITQTELEGQDSPAGVRCLSEPSWTREGW